MNYKFVLLFNVYDLIHLQIQNNVFTTLKFQCCKAKLSRYTKFKLILAIKFELQCLSCFQCKKRHVIVYNNY